MIYLAIIAAIFLGLCALQSSANKDERETKEAATKSKEHVVVSGTPSPGGIVWCVLIVIAICIVATHGL